MVLKSSGGRERERERDGSYSYTGYTMEID